MLTAEAMAPSEPAQSSKLKAESQKNFIAKRLHFFLCRPLTGIEKDLNSLRSLRLERSGR
jgi:hypothetical protein